jgi:1-phosphofructokinase/6-phosphofructokinase 2
MEELLDAAGVPRRSVPVSGALRMNISVLEPDGTTTKLNEPGPQLDPADVDALLTATLEAADGAAWVVGCGSLPPGAPADLYAALVTRVRERGIRVAVDSSGVPMTMAVAARPTLVKPNHEELAELVGHPLPTLGDVHAAARDLVAAGIEVVAVSLGGDGALLVTADELVHARATITAPLSTVGAGDCMLAGLLHGLSAGLAPADALAGAVTWGAAAVTLPGSRVPGPRDLDGIPVEVTHTPDSSLVLR